ncbi:hypothetical protein, partial [Streptomyces sp. NPDC059786]|uniref:hypothetical protein n=1 Tax=Streptomyces sp. NPDC059786 TaxID=3346946 RepID=UPI003669B292
RERDPSMEVRPGQTPAHSRSLIPNTTTRDTIRLDASFGAAAGTVVALGHQKFGGEPAVRHLAAGGDSGRTDFHAALTVRNPTPY